MYAVRTRLLLVALATILSSCKDPELSRADAFLQLEDWPRAVLLYNQVVQEDPHSAEARLGLALSRAGLARDAAVSDLDSASHWIAVARDFSIVEHLDSSLNTASDRADALFHAALCWQRDGRLPQARRAAEEAQATHAPHAPSAQYLGTLARSRNDPSGAERWYMRAIAADSSYLPSWASLGELAQSEGDPEGAIVYWEEGLRRHPDHPWFLSMVQRVRDSLGLATR